jgi:hypothetical protein
MNGQQNIKFIISGSESKVCGLNYAKEFFLLRQKPRWSTDSPQNFCACGTPGIFTSVSVMHYNKKG